MKFVTEFFPMTINRALHTAWDNFAQGQKLRISKANELEYIDFTCEKNCLFKVVCYDKRLVETLEPEPDHLDVLLGYDEFIWFFSLMIRQGYMPSRETPMFETLLLSYGVNPYQKIL